MRAFRCDHCGSEIWFENSRCLTCGYGQLYDPDGRRFEAVAAEEGGILALASGLSGRARCRNADRVGCNWLVVAVAGEQPPFCLSCALTRTRPADDDEAGVESWTKAEAAKRRLVFQLLDLNLPVRPMVAAGDGGLVFDLLSSRDEPVTTGHDEGVVTIDMAEGVDSHREKVRAQLDEPYRTLLGHFRHETGHYYEWLLAERPGRQDELRPVFGDESIDYGAEIDRHYAEGPPAGWPDRFVSAYATMHPYEDFAETFAHYLHIRDTVQTIGAEGLSRQGAPPLDLDAPFTAEDLVATWVPLSVALNAVNRSMGEDDLYPFALAPAVVEKLGAVHALLTGTP